MLLLPNFIYAIVLVTTVTDMFGSSRNGISAYSYKYSPFKSMHKRLGTNRLSTANACASQEELYSFQKRFNSETMERIMKRIYDNNKLTKSIDCYIPFVVKDKVYGYVSQEFAQKLSSYSDTFIARETNAGKFTLHFSEVLENSNSKLRTDAVSVITSDLRELGIIRGWRNELLPVSQRFSPQGDDTSEIIFSIERAAYPLFGTKGYGVHINGYCRGKDGYVSSLWVAKRSKSKSTWPGMYDHIVAGGQPIGLSPMENVIKECQEEANIPSEMSNKAKSVGAVSYLGEDESGHLKRDVLFCFDLELPDASIFTPRPVDGEVESFELKDMNWVLDQVIEGGYKPNCNLVVIDFFVRHGLIPSDAPMYLELVGKLRNGDCS